jgi:hypothetical protein
MKIKSLLVASMSLFAAATFAQEGPKSKDGETILPEKGDWAVSLNLNPVLETTFGKNPNGIWKGLNNYSLVGKKFLDDKTAFRAVVSLTNVNTRKSNEIAKAMAIPNPDLNFGDKTPLVKDTWSNSTTGIVIGGGIEKRKGKGRVQGFYGGEALLSLQAGTKNKFTYGNALTQNPTGDQPDVDADGTYSTNWNAMSPAINPVNLAGTLPQNAGVTSARLLNSTTAGSFGIGVRGFIGAEYFFAPKFSIGGEFGWGLAFQRFGKSSQVWEAEGKLADGSEATAKVSETGLAGSSFSINDAKFPPISAMMNYLQPSGMIKLNFHF